MDEKVLNVLKKIGLLPFERFKVKCVIPISVNGPVKKNGQKFIENELYYINNYGKVCWGDSSGIWPIDYLLNGWYEIIKIPRNEQKTINKIVGLACVKGVRIIGYEHIFSVSDVYNEDSYSLCCLDVSESEYISSNGKRISTKFIFSLNNYGKYWEIAD